MRPSRTWLIVALLLLARPLIAQSSGDDALVKSVFDRLLTAPAAAAAPAKYVSWPPQVAIITAEHDGARADEQMQLNAFAAAPDCRPVVRISQGLVTQIAQGDPDVLALILGHELGHVLLGHPQCTSGREATSVIEMAITRDQEYAADAKGYELALAAGYSPHAGLQGLERLSRVSPYSSFEALSVNHPSWDDRLARLDKEQAPLWHAMSAFSDGVSFLSTENYDLSAQCFRSVLREFPQAADVRGNLGYALLMGYIDSLSDSDLRELGIGELATGSFYGESLSLRSRVRGKDPSQWTEAVRVLQVAEQEDPSLALVKANLGLAYLVQPTGTDPTRALTYLIPATQLLKDDRSLNSVYGDMAVKAVVNNLAVAYLAAGDRDRAMQALQILWEKRRQVTDEQSLLQISALYYNAGTALSMSPDLPDRRSASKVLHQYLQHEAPASIWWRQAYIQYAKVCSLGPDSCLTEAQLKAANQVPIREVAAVDLGAGKSIRLGEPFQQVAAQIGEGQQVSGISNSSVQRLRYPQHALDIVSTDVVLAIILRGKNSPALRIRQVGSDSGQNLIRCGMTTDELERVLNNQPYRYEGLLDTWVPYRFYPAIGIAVRVGPQKTVDEVVLVSSARGSS